MQIPTKVGAFNPLEILVAGGAKVAVERGASGFIGNGTLKSGAIKAALALLLPMLFKNNRYAVAAATGIGVDAIEDVLFGFNVGSFMQPTDGVVRI